MSEEEDSELEIDEALEHLRDLESMKTGFDKMYKAMQREHKRLMKEFSKKLERCEKMLMRQKKKF